MKAYIISALVFLLSILNIKSNLLGIDFGTEFIKITVLKPNSPFKMVENIQSKTKTPAALAFKDEERLFGADALGKKVRFPKQVFVYMHEFLGKKYSSKLVKQFMEDFFVSYETEEDPERKTFNFKVNFNKENFLFSTEEIFGMLFRYIKFLSDKYAGGNIVDCVVTVPAFFGHRERMAISQAVELSNLKLQALITENAAAAVHYSVDKQFNKTENIIFYNMGSSYTQATLVSYLSTFETKNNKTTELKRKINILAESWDKQAGGNRVNYNFIRHLMQNFDSLDARKNKPSVQKDYRVAERILPSVLKYKEILSANKNTPVNILGVENGQNLDGKISRETFEEINKDVFDRIYAPIEKVLQISGLTLEEISQIELLGGSVRIPKVQEVLKSKVNANLIGQHMNGDDSMAFGACFVSANFSSLFKGGKKMEFYHGSNYGIKIKLQNLPLEELQNDETQKNLEFCSVDFNSTEITNECIRKLDKNATLYRIRNLPDSQKKVGFKYDNDVVIKVYQFYDEQNIDEAEKEEFEENSQIMNIKISGVKNAIEFFAKENVTSIPKIELKFDLDRKGLLTLKAEAVNYLILYFQQFTGPTGGTEFIYTPDYVEPYDQNLLEEELKLLNETGANKTTINMAKMKKDIGKKRTQELKKELTVEVEYLGVKPMNSSQIQDSRKKLDSLDEFDVLRIKTMDARNNLESEIYKRREWLENENSQNYIQPEESESATILLKEINEWYEEDGFSANLTVLEKKFKLIKKNFTQVDRRQSIEKKRNSAIEKYFNELNKTYEEGKKSLNKKPWVQEHYNNTFLKELSVIEAWFNENLEKQSKLKLFDLTDFTGEAIESKIYILRRVLNDMNKIQKPKPAAVNTTNLNPDDIQEMLKNGTLNLDDIMKSMDLNKTKIENVTFTANTTNDSNEEPKAEGKNSDDL